MQPTYSDLHKLQLAEKLKQSFPTFLHIHSTTSNRENALKVARPRRHYCNLTSPLFFLSFFHPSTNVGEFKKQHAITGRKLHICIYAELKANKLFPYASCIQVTHENGLRQGNMRCTCQILVYDCVQKRKCMARKTALDIRERLLPEMLLNFRQKPRNSLFEVAQESVSPKL